MQPKLEARLIVGSPSERTLETLVLRRILAMSVADGLRLFNETFARLGIE